MIFRTINLRISTLRLSMLLLLSSVCMAVAATDELASPAEAQLEYLYIDANEARASGGHAAIRIGLDVYHFQFDSGLLAMARDDWADFQLSYRGYQNRNIHATRLAVTPETHALVRESFVRRFITQSAQLDRVFNTRSDQQLLQALSDPADPPISLPGLGFFASPSDASPSDVSASQLPVQSQRTDFAQLREAIAQRYGPDFLARRQRELSQAIVDLEVRALAIRAEDFQPGVLPTPDYAFNQRYADLVAAVRAIDVVLGDWALDPQRLELAALATANYDLDDGERVALTRVIAELEQRLLQVMGSKRPDWGSPLLLGLARLEAMRLSLQRGRWVFVDVLHSDSESLQVGSGIRDNLPGLLDDTYQMALQARLAWLQHPQWDEHSYAELETRVVNAWELQRVDAGADEWRVRDQQGIAQGMGYLHHAPRPAAIKARGDELALAMRESQALAEEYAAEQMGYDLLERNCVSELFTTVDQAMINAVGERGVELSAQSLDHERVRRLGGVIDPSPVPFYSSRQVRKYWRVESHQELYSLRRMYTAEQYRQHSSVGVWLRESNTLTSSVYRRSDEDSFFIFFTDGKAAARPVLGLVNLGAALGVAAVGVVQAPFDAGHNLSAGLRGALFSLPELGFQNIRKGTSTWLVPELREPRQ
jgi:hypothetical protein